jgi:hypothetical protein
MALDKIHTIRWNKKVSLFINDAGLRSAYSRGKGNSAEINLSLIILLRKLGFTAYPVVMRTRAEGFLSAVYPTLQHIDYVVAYAKIRNKFYLLDGTDKDMPFPLLPKRCMNGQGRLVDYDTTGWVPLTNNARSVKRMLYNLKLDENGNLSGTKTAAYSGYAGYQFREDYRDIGSRDDYVDQLMSHNQDLQIVEDTILNLNDKYKPIVEKQTLVLRNQSFNIDSLIYLMVTPERMRENPFKQDKRIYPIDFVHPFERTITVSITLPENYRVARLPKSEILVLPGKAGSFTYRIMASGNHITLYYRFQMNKPFFSQTQYGQLKALYMQAITKEAKPVILKSL